MGEWRAADQGSKFQIWALPRVLLRRYSGVPLVRTWNFKLAAVGTEGARAASGLEMLDAQHNPPVEGSKEQLLRL